MGGTPRSLTRTSTFCNSCTAWMSSRLFSGLRKSSVHSIKLNLPSRLICSSASFASLNFVMDTSKRFIGFNAESYPGHFRIRFEDGFLDEPHGSFQCTALFQILSHGPRLDVMQRNRQSSPKTPHGRARFAVADDPVSASISSVPPSSPSCSRFHSVTTRQARTVAAGSSGAVAQSPSGRNRWLPLSRASSPADKTHDHRKLAEDCCVVACSDTLSGRQDAALYVRQDAWYLFSGASW